MAGFNPKDYVDVAERLRVFYAKHPDGSIQSELTRLPDGWLCKAFAYRSPADSLPGIGHAFEPVPGRTTFTKDSEAMNAETSAWGRAIVACGFPTKKIASADEVRNRQDGGSSPEPKEAATSAAAGEPPTGHSSSEEEEGLTAAIFAAAETLGVHNDVVGMVADSKRKRTPEEHLAWLRRNLKTAQANVEQMKVQA